MGIKPIKVSQVNSYIKRILQTDPLLGNINVIGEISNLKIHGSGHIYFTLKDANSKLNCFLPSDRVHQLRFSLEEGMEVTAVGYIYVYERGGSYSLNVKDIIVEGVGNLSLAFQKLKSKLESEGIFDKKYKKALPQYPKKVAVITSETGAAVKDILKILKQRNNIIEIIVYPCLVQGPGAANDISRAIEKINDKFSDIDIIILGRGGGSMEELWPFNEEIVARSIFLSNIPIISAVGHETDFTIADFVADLRAATPTEAAQLAVPDIQALKRHLNDLSTRLFEHIENHLKNKELLMERYNYDWLKTHIKTKINFSELRINNLGNGLNFNIRRKLDESNYRLNKLKTELDSANPHEIMKRGYGAIVTDEGFMAGSVTEFKQGDFLTVIFRDGKIRSCINKIWSLPYDKE